MNTPPAERAFYANPLFTYMMIAVAILLIPLQFIGGSSPLSGLNIVLFISVGIMFKMRPLAVIYDEHMTYRAAPIRGLNFLRYADINEINVKGKKMFVTANNDSPLKIHLNSFSSADREDLIRILRSKQKM